MKSAGSRGLAEVNAMLKRHTLVPECKFEKIRYELRP